MAPLVVVLSTDSLRALSVRELLQQCQTFKEMTLAIVRDVDELVQLLAHSGQCILFCDAEVREKDDVARVTLDELTSVGKGVHVVYMGVTGHNLVDLEYANHAFLLPPQLDKKCVEMALSRALAMQEMRLEAPIVLRTHHFSRVLQPSRVSFVESALRKVRIHSGDDVIETYGKLSDLMAELPRCFVQCHKSFVVNLSYVYQLNKDSLVLTTGACVPVSQKRRCLTREALLSYVGRTF